jgi:ADP-ribose pyrophosphatase
MSRKVDVVDQETLFQGYSRVRRYRLRHETFAGGMSGEISREVFERGHAAAALPYDPDRDEVVLLEQFRIGGLAADVEPWMIEIVAGIIDPGETPEDVVRREMLEESGLEARQLEDIGKIMPTPGAVNEIVQLYCARVDSSNAGGVFGLDHEGEDIRAFVLSTDSALAMIGAGRILNAPAIIALQWLALNRTRLRGLWNG